MIYKKMIDDVTENLTLREALVKEPTIFSNIQMSTTSRTNELISRLTAMYNNRPLGSDSIDTFKLWITDKFNEIKIYYENKLNIYERELNGDDGKKISRATSKTNNAQTATTNASTGSTNGSSDTINYDLPRTTTPVEKPTTKVHTSDTLQNAQNATINSSGNGSESVAETITGDVNVIEQREKWLKFIRDLYLDMCKEFKDCFALVYA